MPARQEIFRANLGFSYWKTVDNLPNSLKKRSLPWAAWAGKLPEGKTRRP